MFVDVARVNVQAGDGGHGAVSFRHEKFVERGGPDGGDGGHGGNVVFVASRNQNTLASFRYQKLLRAQSGELGSKRKKHGKSGDDLQVPVPVGTVVATLEGELIADLVNDGQNAVVAKGGSGGFGNAHFTSSTRQAPRVAEKGEKGERLEVILELKMIADVGLIGLPNAGKSTLLSVISSARPAIANYPFTTITPNLGMVDIDKTTGLLFADIPGLIEGASQGKGLGDEFLRHVERTSVLVHLIDAYQDNVAQAYEVVQKELRHYSADLTKRPQVVVLTRIDGLDREIVDAQAKELRAVLPRGTKLTAVSSKNKQGVKELLFVVNDLVKKQRAKQAKQSSVQKQGLPVLRLPASKDEAWKVTKSTYGFTITGAKIERFAQRTDFSNPHGVQRLRDIMRKMGIVHELERHKAVTDQKITIGDPPIGSIKY